MSGAARLLNTSVLTNDPIAAAAEAPGRETLHHAAAEASGRIPVPWLCAFRHEDLRPVELRFRSDSGAWQSIQCSVPCAPVASVAENLRTSLEVFETIVGVPLLARGYWRRSLEDLGRLTLPFVTLDPVGVLRLGDLRQNTALFARCFGRSAESIEAIRSVSGYVEGVTPFAVDEWRTRSPRQTLDERRSSNSIALDSGIHGPASTTRDAESVANRGLVPKASRIHTRPWWRLW